MNKLVMTMLISAFGLIGATAFAQGKSGSTVTLEGQVVCSSCWYEEDRAVKPYGDEGDLKCAVTCSKRGVSQAIAVKSDRGFSLYLLEPGKLMRERSDWLDFIAQRVKATGSVREADGKHYLKVDSIELASAAREVAAKSAPEVSQDSDVQAVKVTVGENGYEPATFHLKPDVPARVTFVRTVKDTCGTEVVIQGYDIKRKLPLDEPVVVEFTPRKGEITFTCGMGMLKGKIIVD